MANLSDFPIDQLKPDWDPYLCGLAASLYVDLQIKGMNATDLPISTITKFLKSLPPPLNVSSSGELCDWWINSWNTRPSDASVFVQKIDNGCHKQVCRAIDWPGDPDIAGIGMIVVYSTFLSIVLLYTFAYLWSYWLNGSITNFATSKHDDGVPQSRCITAFQGTIQDLLDLAIAFTLAAQISTLTFHSSAATRYEMVVTELLCIFASAAISMLWIFHCQTGRFKVTRFTLYLFALLLPIPVVAIHVAMRGDMGSDFAMTCLDMKINCITNSKLRDVLLFTAWTTIVIIQVVFNLVVLPPSIHRYNAEHPTGLDTKSRTPSVITYPMTSLMSFSLQKQHKRWFLCLYTLGSMLGCAVMIGCYIEIWRLRKKLQAATGIEYNENSWGFGQIYALATWLPLLPSFVAIACGGSQPFFDARLPAAWKAIQESTLSCNCMAGSCRCTTKGDLSVPSEPPSPKSPDRR